MTLYTIVIEGTCDKASKSIISDIIDKATNDLNNHIEGADFNYTIDDLPHL